MDSEAGSVDLHDVRTNEKVKCNIFYMRFYKRIKYKLLTKKGKQCYNNYK